MYHKHVILLNFICAYFLGENRVQVWPALIFKVRLLLRCAYFWVYTVCFENTPHRIPEFLPGRSIDTALESQWNVPTNIFWPLDLDLWPLTLTYELDLDILPLDLHAKIQICSSVRSAVRVVTDTQTDTHTHAQTMSNCYTRHVTDVGCKKQWATIGPSIDRFSSQNSPTSYER